MVDYRVENLTVLLHHMNSFAFSWVEQMAYEQVQVLAAELVLGVGRCFLPRSLVKVGHMFLLLLLGLLLGSRSRLLYQTF